MAKDQGIVQTAMRRRTPFKAPAGAATPAEERKRPFNPLQFLREVDAERKKVTWTSWKETWITSVMVGIMVIITAIFFFGVDSALGALIGQVLKFANAG